MATHYQVRCGGTTTKRLSPRRFAVWVRAAAADGRKVALEYDHEYHTYWAVIEGADE